MTTTKLASALEHLESSWDAHLATLCDLVRIGGVSADPPPNPTLVASAKAVAKTLAEAGLENIEIITVPGGHPYVIADWLHAAGKPTALLYGHHDVQPPGRAEKWLSPPFEPTMREDGRLYGRGAVDDKAGVMAHVAACAAWLKGAGSLPLNVKFVIEGEEEIGSETLGTFLEQHKERLAADVIVLTDTANLAEGVPSITTSLRGLAGVFVEVSALDHPVHSGMWGGALPDPVMALTRAIAELTEPDGRPVASLRKGLRPVTSAELGRLKELPFSEAEFRSESGVLDGVALVGNPELPIWARVWREPSLTVIAFEARPIAGSSNQIIESARARISVRVVPDQDPEEISRALVKHFETRVPWGCHVRVEAESTATWWMTDPTGPAFEAASVAMERGFGRRTEYIGCGGSIPFVEPFARVLGGVPALLMGVEDPRCNAHGENESLHVEDWKKATRAAVHLYSELARLPKR